MLSILVVGSKQTELGGPGPEVEILRARDAEEAVEKLGRNRRIDAVLLVSPGEALAVISAIREENPAPPPLFIATTEAIVPPDIRRVSQDPTLALRELLALIE
jgi:hypothetical protein